MEVKTFKLGSNNLCITSATYLFAVYLWMKDGFLGTCVHSDRNCKNSKKKDSVTLITCGLIFVRLKIFKEFKSIPGLFGIWIISRLGWVKPQISHKLNVLKVEVNELDYNEQASNPLIQAEIMTLFQNFLICCKF